MKVHNTYEENILIQRKIGIEKVSTTVQYNGEEIFTQTVDKKMWINKSARTFVDRFIKMLFSNHIDEITRNTGKVICNGCNILELIPERRSKGLNLKQKFFYFLLKQVFLKSKPTPVVNIESLCKQNKIKNGGFAQSETPVK